MPEKSLEEKIREKQRQDMQDLAQQLGSTTSEASPDTPPSPPSPPSVAAETDPAAGAAKPKPKFFGDVAEERSPSSWEKKDGAEEKPKPADVPPSAMPSTPDQQPYAYRRGDEFAATSRDWKEKGNFTKISDREKWMKISEEDLDLNAQLAEMKKEVDEFGKNYSKLAGEAGAKQNIIRKLNPFSNPEDYDEVKQARAEWEQKRDEFERAFYQDLAMKFSKGEIDEKTVDRLSNNFDTLIIKEAISAHGQKFDYRKDYSEGKGWLSLSVAKGYNNFIGKFRKMHPALRIGMGAGIFVLGNIPATMVWRALGGLVAGKGAHEGLQAAAELWRQRKERKSLQKFEKDLSRRNLSAQERINMRLERLERKNQGMERRMKKYARGDYYRKFAGVVVAGLIGGGTMARLIQSTGIGSAIKEKMFGGGAASSVEHLRPSGGVPKDLSPEDYARIKKAMAPYGPEHNMDEIVAGEVDKTYAGGVAPEAEAKSGGSLQEWAKTAPEAGAEVNVPEDIQKPSLAPESAEAKMSDMRAPDAQTPEINKPKFEEIASGEFGNGGSIEGKVMAAIEAKPEEFGLHQSDPDFATKALEMKKNIIEDFYKKKGFKSYAEFDRYCRKNVWEKDVFRIVHNPVTRDIILECKGHGFHDVFSTGDVPDVSLSGTGAAQEVAPSKAGMTADDAKPKASVAPEDATKPRAGATTEQQPTRARGGQTSAAQELTPQQRMEQIAQADQELAARHPEKFADISNKARLAEIRQAIATKPGMIRILDGASFSEKADVWNKSASSLYNQIMSHGNYIAHDVISADAVKGLNENNIRLMAMFLKFGKPQPGELFENYYQRIFTNSRNIPFLNTFISEDIEKLVGHPIK